MIPRLLALAAFCAFPFLPRSAAAPGAPSRPSAHAQGGQQQESSAFRLALSSAERALEAGLHDQARALIERALERDRSSTEAWALRARWAQAIENRDELVYSLHRRYNLAVAQRFDRRRLAELRAELLEVDPIAPDLLGMNELFIDKLVDLAAKYEKDGRPHGAIRVLKKVVALDPEHAGAKASIERIAAAPDPSLAGDAKPKDLFADVSSEWIAEHDAKHSTWDSRAKLERENYTTYTDAGYVVLLRAAESMEQMNAFYRQFFRFGTEEDGGTVPRIELWIFKNRDDYLKLGNNPPEWSAGIFTGSSVQTFTGGGGFEGMVGTLFHEAAHQFVSLATSAVGWLNEGLASFFEGTRILPNGTVIMNMPANHRLFPLAERIERGWMDGPNDGIDPADPGTTPERAPRWRTVLENKYAWGPPWYAPTWGVVYFLYNYQDPVDGRFVYRDAFSVFIDKSGGRVGEGAVKNFEEVVLGNPSPPIKGVERPADAPAVVLPKTTEELDDVYREWILRLRDEQQGKLEVERPYHQWGLFAMGAQDWAAAKDHFEKGLVAQPDDIALLIDFADLLAARFADADRASKLVLEAIHSMEAREEPDLKRLEAAERLLGKLDPKRRTMAALIEDMGAAARSVVQRYDAEGLPSMVMDVSWRLGRDLELGHLFEYYEDALRRSGKSLQIWELAYNERDMEGWNVAGDVFRPDGSSLLAHFGEFDERRFDYQVLTMDRVAGGDFSMDARVQAARGEVNFCGFVFGRKGASSFHALLLFPGKTVAEGGASTGYVDLMSNFGGEVKTWRHVPVDTGEAEPEVGRTTAGGESWHSLRLDVAGRFVDVWFEGELLATHEFSSADVLRGSFGLICGPGRARFRDVRYLARDPRDPASSIERAIRMEALAAGAGAASGSFLGQVPPFPEVGRWVQGERASWEEAGPVPQLFVLWSTHQNELVAIDGWLRELAEAKEPLGLEIVSLCSPNDAESIDAYLAEHPFPGAVAVDARPEGDFGIGTSFTTFAVDRWNLPRLLLLDLDQKVVWEGDPGFEIGAPRDPSVPTYLDAPLEELIDKRKLEALRYWSSAWQRRGAPALARGELAEALPILRDSMELDRRFSPEVATAQARLGALEAALSALPATAASLQRERADAAMTVVLDWCRLLDIEVTGRAQRDLGFVLQSDAARGWERVLKDLDRIARKRDPWEAKAAELAGRLAGYSCRFTDELAAELEAAREASDWSAVEQLFASAAERPRLWLAREFFRW